jgi:hypothetical protein
MTQPRTKNEFVESEFEFPFLDSHINDVILYDQISIHLIGL